MANSIQGVMMVGDFMWALLSEAVMCLAPFCPSKNPQVRKLRIAALGTTITWVVSWCIARLGPQPAIELFFGVLGYIALAATVSLLVGSVLVQGRDLKG